MIKPNNGFILVFLSVIILTGCKKKKGEENPVNPKLAAYSTLGYNYLFTIDKNNSDSILPVFIAKANAGFYKLVIKEFKNGTISNKGFKQVVGNIVDWTPGLSIFNDLNRFHECVLDEKGYFTLNNFYSENGNTIFNNVPGFRGMNAIVFQDDAVFFEVPEKHYKWPCSYAKNLTNVKRKKGNVVSVYENCYRANLYKQGNFTYFLYNQPEALDAYTYGAFLNFQMEDNYGTIIKKKLVKGNIMVTLKGGCDGQYTDGLEIYPISAGKDKPPVFVFLRYKKTFNNLHQEITLFYPENLNSLISANITFDNEDQYMNFFIYNSAMYLTSFNSRNQYNNCNLYKLIGDSYIKQELKLNGIRGIFGNENGIVAVVQNDSKGLDFVSVN